MMSMLIIIHYKVPLLVVETLKLPELPVQTTSCTAN